MNVIIQFFQEKTVISVAFCSSLGLQVMVKDLLTPPKHATFMESMGKEV